MTDGDRQDELELVCRLREGDEESFVEFVRRFEKSVFLCCKGMGLDGWEAEEAASEVFVAAYEGIGKFGCRSSLSTWLWKIAYHKCADRLRGKKRAEIVRERAAEKAGGAVGGDVSTIVEGKERAEIVWEKVRGLPTEWGVAIILFYREGKSISETAAIMGAKEGTVKTYLYRGKERLRNVLERIWREQFNEVR